MSLLLASQEPSLSGQINCSSNTIKPITKLVAAIPRVSLRIQATAGLIFLVPLTGQINCSSKTFLPHTKLGKAAVPVTSFTIAATCTLTVIPVQGQAQALAGSIICTLKFGYDPNAIPNDQSFLSVNHTLQGRITDALLFNPQFTPQDTAPLNLTITLQGKIDGICIIRDGFTAYFTVAHTTTSNIITGVNITGGSNLAITTQSSCACLAVLSAQLAIDHPLQGFIITVLTVNDSFFNVNHTLVSQVILSSSLLSENNLNETSRTGIADVNVFSGSLNVDHPLAGSVITILGFNGSCTITHPVQGLITCDLIVRDSFFTVAHSLSGKIEAVLSGSNNIDTGAGVLINTSSTLTGSLTVAHTLQGIITTALILQGIFYTFLTGQINCSSNTIKPITRLGKISTPRAAFLPAAQGTLTVFGLRSIQGQINCINTIIGSCNVLKPLISRIFLESSLADIPIAGECVVNGILSILTILLPESVICVSTLIAELLVNHNLISSVVLTEDNSGTVLTGNNGNLVAVSTITGSLNKTIALQGNILDSCSVLNLLNLSQQYSVLIPGGCGLQGSLNVARVLDSYIFGVLDCVGLVAGGAPTVTFPGDFVTTTAEIRLLIVPTRTILFKIKRIIYLYTPKKITLFDNFKRILRLFVLK